MPSAADQPFGRLGVVVVLILLAIAGCGDNSSVAATRPEATSAAGDGAVSPTPIPTTEPVVGTETVRVGVDTSTSEAADTEAPILDEPSIEFLTVEVVEIFTNRLFYRLL